MLERLSGWDVRQYLLIILILLVIYIASSILRVGHRAKGLPPGPPTAPFFGNELQIPKADAHFLFMKWAEKYGGLFSLKRFWSTTVVLSDWRYVKELLDRKSTKYSFRPKSTVADIIARGDHILMMQYSDRWRTVRKLIHQVFMESKCEKEHYIVQEAEASQMIHDFMVNPGDNMLHPKRFSNSITMSLVFGIRAETVEDPYIARLYHAMEKWSLVLETGATPPVDAFPLLKLIPERFLGRWRARATECGDLMRALYFDVLRRIVERRARGIDMHSLMDAVLDKQDQNKFTDHQLAFLGGTLMEGGSDTSSSLILAIIQAMTKYPAVQKRAQAEIDSVVGTERSPRWADFARLPYINMIIKEAHRWRPVLPLGVVHGIQEADDVDGMHLPPDSTVIINVWGLHHDVRRWERPEDFIPERYSDFPELAPVYAASKDYAQRDHLGYGASRRICPGIHLAERNLWIATAKLLWAFDFSIDPNAANDTNADTGSSQGFMHCVKDYGCRVTLRDEAKRETVMREFAEAKTIFAQFE